MILCNYDSNAILAEGCKSRTGTELTVIYDILYTQLTKVGIVLVIQRIDNEVSNILITSIKEKNMLYQFGSPHDHGLNPTERAIQTWKNYFIRNLNGCDRDFLVCKWSDIMHQYKMTLDMLRRLVSIQRCQFTLKSLDCLFSIEHQSRHWE